MTEETPSAIGTVAQEAARLIEDMATMARSSFNGVDDPSPYAGQQAPEAASPQDAGLAGDHETRDRGSGDHETRARDTADESTAGVCSVCGADGDDTPASCRICPLCRGIALMRSVRPETVDLLADLALSVAAGLRDVAARSRASAPPSSRPAPGGHPDGERTTVQDIPVDDESE